MNKDYMEQAKDFDSFAEQSYPWKFIEKPTLDTILKTVVKPDTKALDLGSGGGRIVRYLESLGVSPNNIVGIDHSRELVEISKMRSPNANLMVGDITNIETLGGLNWNFDVITSIHVFEHLDLEQLKKCLKTCYDKMEKGGVFVCLVGHPFRYIESSKYNNNYWYKQMTPWGKEVSHYHKKISDYITCFIDAGFRIEKMLEPKVIEEGKTDMVKFEDYNNSAFRLVFLASK